MKQDSTSHYLIKQSVKCFQEQKSLGKIIYNQDSIIQSSKYFDSIKNVRVVKEFKILIDEKNDLQGQNNNLKSQVKFLYGIMAVETITILALIIF